MDKKLTRLGIIEYCKKCKHVRTDSSTTICGLTNQIANFEYGCEKYLDKNSVVKESSSKAWILPLILTVLGLIRLAVMIGHGKFNIFGFVVLLCGVIWLTIEIIKKASSE